MGYIQLKHTLAEIALDVAAHPGRAPLAAALAAYGRISQVRDPVPLADLAAETGLPADEIARLIGKTELFDQTAGGQAVSLAASLRPFAPYLRRQTARLEEALAAFRSSEAGGLPPAVWHGAVLFNAGLFFECHEYLEDVWRAAPPAERAFYHGLVQAAAGCYHLEKGNLHGARTLVAKAIAKLEPYGPAHLGVDVAAFLRGLRDLIASVDASPLRHAWSRGDLPTLPLIRPAPPLPETPSSPRDARSSRTRGRSAPQR